MPWIDHIWKKMFIQKLLIDIYFLVKRTFLLSWIVSKLIVRSTLYTWKLEYIISIFSFSVIEY